MWQESSQGGTLTGPLGYMFTLRHVQRGRKARCVQVSHGLTRKMRVRAARLQGHRLWALGVGRVDGCWVGTLERSGRCGWSCVYTITPDEGSVPAAQGIWVLFPRNLTTRSALGAGGRPVQPAGAEIPEARRGVCGGGGGAGRGLGGVPLLTRRPAALAWPPRVLRSVPAARWQRAHLSLYRRRGSGLERVI